MFAQADPPPPRLGYTLTLPLVQDVLADAGSGAGERALAHERSDTNNLHAARVPR